jgi:hypothetical protein
MKEAEVVTVADTRDIAEETPIAKCVRVEVGDVRDASKIAFVEAAEVVRGSD